MPVSVLLVSHNGARWLPAVLAGVEQQTHPPDRLVALDTGSDDDSVGILRRAGAWDVHQVANFDSYGEVVRAGLDLIPASSGSEPDWVWLLHDDSSPDPNALEQLLTAASEHPEIAIFGPKLREWPSLRRLIELGVTISGTGRRETGLERGEYDQGQHDERRVVLAVNTAGMLVRRDLLVQLGFDPELKFFGNDIDFGWRAARAGHSTMVIPEALVFHAEAAHRGQRTSRLAAYHHRQERQAAIFTLLANGSGRGVPFRIVRLTLGTVLRALGFLLVRAPSEARHELVALGSVVGRPGRLLAARRQRRVTNLRTAKDVRHLLAPPWLPYRHGLDYVGDVGTAAIDVAREAVGGRTVRSADLVDTDDAAASQERGLVGLLLRNPRFWLVVGSILLALVAARDLLTGGPLHGGALLPAPAHLSHWWSSYVDANHLLGTGSAAPAPAYVLPLAVGGTLLLGHPGWLVSVIFLLSVPLAALSALRFFRRLVPGRVAPLWGAVAYGLLPVMTGAVAQGRLGTVAGAIVLPWVATSALGLWATDDDRRWRSVWRTALGAGVLTAFVPVAWLLGLLVALGAIVVGTIRDPGHWRRLRWWTAPIVVVVAVPFLLMPWVLGVTPTRDAWLVEAGRVGVLASLPTLLDLATARAGGPGNAPAWVGAGLLVAGLVAGFRADTRRRVLVAWAVAALAGGMIAFVARAQVDLPGVEGQVPVWVGFLVVVLFGALISAAVVAGDGVWQRITTAGFSWRQPVAAVGLVGAVVAVVGGVAWWVVGGTQGPLDRSAVRSVPSYMSDLSASDPANGVLVVRGGSKTGVEYQVLRDGPLRTGDDAIAALTPPDDALTRLVGRVLGDPQGDDARALADYGVSYVYAPSPVSAGVAGSLDAATGFSRASAPTDDAAWRLQDRASGNSMNQDPQPFHGWLLAGQLVAIVVCIVLALPTRRERS